MPLWDASPESHLQPESVYVSSRTASVAHTVATNHGLSVGLPGPMHLSLMLQTFGPRYVTSYH